MRRLPTDIAILLRDHLTRRGSARERIAAALSGQSFLIARLEEFPEEMRPRVTELRARVRWAAAGDDSRNGVDVALSAMSEDAVEKYKRDLLALADEIIALDASVHAG